jgi:hypothetical protein
MRVYGFQITPGSDNSLGDCESAEDAYQKARVHRQDIRRAAAPERLDPTAVYEIELAKFTADALVAVLNDPDTLAEAFFSVETAFGICDRGMRPFQR